MSGYYDERFPVPLPGRLRRELKLPRPPWWLVLFVVLLILFGVIPLALILHSRTQLSEKPRVHLIQDMDVQPRYGPQVSSAVFADGRSMRLPPEGSVARGSFAADPGMQLGYELRGGEAGRELHFLQELPEPLRGDPRLLERGRQRYAIFCVTCHGEQGDGQGPVHLQALARQESRWVPPSDLLSGTVRELPDGHIYNTIRNGIRGMPPHAEQIDVQDRWAIVAWIRQLQREHAAPDAPLVQQEAALPANAPR
jgi:mono/diheme cytochrome c family protein